MQRTGIYQLPYGHGLGEAAPFQLTIDSPYQVVGGKATWTLIGAPPGAQVLWESYKDGVFTGEINSGYGQTVESNGTAILVSANPWTEADKGTWIKKALVMDGSTPRSAIVQFRVGAAAPAPGSTPVQSGGNFLTDPLFNIGDFEVTGLWAIIGGFALYKIFGKR